MRIVALLPAHNEAGTIEDAVRGLLDQTRPPDRIVVVADNCTDDTVALALDAGADVIETAGNVHKKAGALNQALDALLPELDPSDGLFVQDADSAVDATFLEAAVASLEDGHSAAGGVFRGGPGGGFVGWLQRNEYARYARDVERLDGKVLVLTGTATLFRVAALMDVALSRGGRLPGRRGDVYDTAVLTEDNELTFALMHLGHRYVSPRGCTLVTEVMPTWRALWLQRLRWKRGAVENLVQYGFPRWSWAYWGRQVLSAIGVLVSVVYLATIAAALLGAGVGLHPIWLAITGVYAAERALTVHRRGWAAMLAGGLLLIEMPYDFALQAVHAHAILGSILRTEKSW